MARALSWRTRLVIVIGAWLASWILRLLYWTQRWKLAGVPPRKADAGREKPRVYAFWHQRILPFVYSHRKRGIVVIVSRHRDGEWITRVIGHFGFRTARGSTTRGGARALRAMMKATARAEDVAFTPDGPRGPRYELQPGVVHFAARQGLPIVLGAATMTRYWELKSWDRFRIPKPFGTIVVHQSEEYAVPEGVLDDAERLEEFRAHMQSELRRLTEEVDAGAGVPTSPPPSAEEVAKARRRVRRSL